MQDHTFQRRLKENGDLTVNQNKHSGVEMSSIRHWDNNGVYFNGDSDYFKLSPWPISGPFFIGGLFKRQCDDCILFSIPLTFSNNLYFYGTGMREQSFFAQGRTEYSGEFVAYLENGFVKAKLKIGDMYWYLTSSTEAPTDWFSVQLAC